MLSVQRPCKFRAMKIHHQAKILESDIDSLGHMNVRVYARHASQGAQMLIQSLGLLDLFDGQANIRLEDYDCYTTFRREQLLGSTIEVSGGVLDIGSNYLELYLELRNSKTRELAAAFRKRFKPLISGSRRSAEFPDAFVKKRLADQFVDWPENLRPRSLELGPIRDDVLEEDLKKLDVQPRFGGYTVTDKDVTDDGFMDMTLGTWLAFAKRPIKLELGAVEAETAKESSWFGEGEIAVATLESRQTLIDIPSLGEEVISYTAITDIKPKIVRFCHWSYETGSGRLLAVLDEVGIGLNLETRRSCEFPSDMRSQLEQVCQPALRPLT